MANLAYLTIFCRNGHYRNRMYFIGYDFAGNAKYRCGICGCIRRYRFVYGRVKRIA